MLPIASMKPGDNSKRILLIFWMNFVSFCLVIVFLILHICDIKYSVPIDILAKAEIIIDIPLVVCSMSKQK